MQKNCKDYKDYIDKIASEWNFGRAEILKQYDNWDGRFVLLTQTETQGKRIVKATHEDGFKTMISSIRALEYLGKKNQKMVPELVWNIEGGYYTQIDGFYFYVMEYIEGRKLEASPEDEYKLGEAAAVLHSFNDYPYQSCYDIRNEINKMKERFSDYDFKTEYDEIIRSFPDFGQYRQSFIHTDIGPHNAMMDSNGNVVFIDLDDAGTGSPYMDFGWSFIMQFVDYNRQTGEMRYEFDNAKAFFDGYNSKTKITRQEMELVWAGAILMHMSNMSAYGPDGVLSMWNILKFGMEQKNKVFEILF